MGTADSDPHPTPMLVPELPAVAMLASGRNHVVALTFDGELLAWGLNSSNQVGEDGIGEFVDDIASRSCRMALCLPGAGVFTAPSGEAKGRSIAGATKLLSLCGFHDVLKASRAWFCSCSRS